MLNPEIARKLVRTIVVSLIGTLAAIALIVAVSKATAPVGYYGWNVGTDGVTISYVTPEGPAYRAGIRAGDRIDYRSVPLAGRINLELNRSVEAGEALTVRVFRNAGARTVTLHAARFPQSIVWVYAVLPQLLETIFIAIAIALVLLRPSLMTWAFLMFGVQWTVPLSVSPSTAWHFGTILAGEITGGLAVSGMLIFATRFPTDVPLPWLRPLERAAIPLGVFTAAFGVYFDVALLVGTQPPSLGPPLIQDLVTALQYAIPFAAVFALVARYVTVQSSVKHRLVFVIASMICYILFSTATAVSMQYVTDVTTYQILGVLVDLSLVALAVAVADGVFRKRVFDVSYIISRTLVYTILTAAIVAVFALLDFLLGKWLAESRVALVYETAVAIAAGLWLNAMHGRVDRFVDRVFFRRRHAAESRLARAAAALPHALSFDLADEMIALEPAEVLWLASSAVFRRDGNRFVRGAACGWTTDHCTTLEATDRLTLHLQAELEPIRLSEIHVLPAMPSGVAQPLVAFPIFVRHELDAIALYGGHTGGESIDPDEMRSLAALAVSAGVAYDHIQAGELRQTLENLQTQNAAYQTEHEAITQIAESLMQHLAIIEKRLEARAL